MDQGRTAVVDRASDDLAWGDIVSRTVFPLVPVRQAPDFTGSIRHLELTDAVRVGEVETDPIGLRRTPRLLRQTPTDELLLLVHLHGDSTVSQGDRVTPLEPISATVLDPTDEYWVSSAKRASQLVITIPRRVAMQFASNLDALRAAPLTQRRAGVQAVASLVASAVHAPTVIGDEAVALAEAIEQLTATIVAPAVAAPAAGLDRLALRARAESHIQLHLRDPELSPDTVAAALHVSTRTLSNVFSGAASPAAYIRRERILAAHRELLQGSALTIADLGAKWGFDDPTTFTRAFKREFEVTPTELLRSNIGTAAENAD